MRTCARLQLGLLLALAAIVGCDGNGSASSNNDAPTQQDVAPPKPQLPRAPKEFPALLAWAETELKKQPDKVPLPKTTNLSRDIWPVIRLTDERLFKRSSPSSPWQPKEVNAAPLGEVGPFATATGPTRTFNMQRAPAATPDGREGVKLIMGGFNIERSDVGMIDLRLKIPFGRKCTLKWGKAGEIPILISTNEESFNVRLLTEGLAEWRGPLKSIQLITDGYDNQEQIRGIEVERIRFLPQSHAYPFGLAIKRVRVGTAIKDAIYTHSPAKQVYRNLALPEPAAFSASLAVDGDSEEAVTFIVSARRGDETTELLRETVPPGQDWRDVRVELDAFAGGNTDLILETECARPETVGIWGTPEIFRPDPDAPLVVLYLIDTLSSEHLDLYGFQRKTAPVISALGREGAWFQQMTSNSPRTVESVPDMMLSMTTERHGVHHNLTPAAKELVTIADALQTAGFATSAYVTNVYAGPRANMDQGFTTFVDKIAYHWTTDRSFADRTVPLDETLGWIDANADRPRFMYIHTAEPHAPYTPPEGFRGTFDQNYDGPFDGTYGDRKTKPHFHQARRTRDIQHIYALYDEEIRYADAQLGKFLAGLKQRNLLERMNIFITADHGEEFYQHGAWEHGLNMHNEQTRVPLVVAGPMIPAQGKLDTPAATIDVMPTLLDLFGLEQPYPLEGRSLVPALQARRGGAAEGKAPEPAQSWDDRVIFGSNHNYRGRGNHVEYFAIEGHKWKLIYGARQLPMNQNGDKSRFALFDIEADPRERNNVIATNQDVAARLIEKLVHWRLTQQPYDVSQSRSLATQDAEQIRQLEAMGYVGGDEIEEDE